MMFEQNGWLRLACAVALGGGCTVAAFGASDANLERARGGAAHGSNIFESQCASCHGLRGEGRGSAPAIIGESALERYPRRDSTIDASATGSGGPEGSRHAPAPDMGRPELVNARSLHTYLVYHMPKVKKQPLTDSDYWAVVNFMLLAHGSDVPAEGISGGNADTVAIRRQ